MSPAARSSSVSPTHRIGASPASSAAGTLAWSARSVSLSYSRRSEWPSSTAVAPASVSMAAETSPVNAPDSSADIVCAPTVTPLPFRPDTTVSSAVKGTNRPTSAAGSPTSEANDWQYSAAWARVPQSFQLPVM